MANDEELDYVSTSPFLNAPPQTLPQDEIDKPTLVRVQKMIDEQIDSYEKITSLTVDTKTFTIKQQLACNLAMVQHLTELKQMIQKTLSDIREKYNG